MERIKNISEQAHLMAVAENGNEFGYYNTLYNQMFAELIIRECASILPEMSGDEWGTYRDQIYEHFGLSGFLEGEEITKEHFGVK